MFQTFWKLLIVVSLIVTGSRADLGLVQVIPNLVPSVDMAIGVGLAPLLKANATIEVNVNLDRSGALPAVVTVTNIVNATIGGVYAAAQQAVVDNKSTPNVVFGSLYKAGVTAEIELQDAITVAKTFKTVVRQATASAVLGNVTALQGLVENLTSAYIEIGAAVNTFQLSPSSSKNISDSVTPNLVNNVAYILSNITLSVSNLGALFTEVVKDKNNATVYVANIGGTVNVSITNITRTVEQFTKSVNNATLNLVQPIRSVTTNIAESYADITQHPKDYNGGNITGLVVFLGVVGNANFVLGLNATTNLNLLQANVNRSMAVATATAANSITNSIKYITNKTSTSDSSFGAVCSERYYQQLQKLAPRVSLLSNCLTAEEPSLSLNYKLLITPLLSQLQTEASSFGSAKLKACAITNGSCSNTYFSAFLTLAEEAIFELQLIDKLIRSETRSFSTRIQTCANATAGDVVELAQQIVGKYDLCLMSGQ